MERDLIIKALECCVTTSAGDCENCGYRGKSHDNFITCTNCLIADALALIKSQEQKSKELTEENERLRADKDYWKNRAKESESEYDQAVKRGYELGAVDYVKSFAERLKAEIEQTPNANEHFIKAWKSKIDQIAKEMLMEDNNND
jgi:hypothetical protein